MTSQTTPGPDVKSEPKRNARVRICKKVLVTVGYRELPWLTGGSGVERGSVARVNVVFVFHMRLSFRLFRSNKITFFRVLCVLLCLALY